MDVFLRKCIIGFLSFSLSFSSFPSFAQTSTPNTLLDSNSQGVFVSNQEPSPLDVMPSKAKDPDATSAHEQDSLNKELGTTLPQIATSSVVIDPVASSTVITQEPIQKTVENKGNIAFPAPTEPVAKLTYPELMREFRYIQLGKEYDDTPLIDTEREFRRAVLLKNLTEYAKTEVNILRELGVSSSKQKAFLSSIYDKIRALGGEPTWWDKIKTFFRDLFGLEEPSMQVIIKQDLPDKPLIPEKPSSFSPPSEPPPAQETKAVEIEDQPIPDDPSLQEQLKNLIITQKADADTNDLPTLIDITKQDSEVVLAYEIRNLASFLDHNPAKIFNFVRNQISYEPYPGSKKGALGCLKERICNDTDTSSLVIALFRASGIPARYKTSPIIASKAQLTKLTRTQDLKGAYLALSAANGIVALPPDAPPFPQGKDFLQKADFSTINALYLEWTYVQMFYEYDERGANVSNSLDLSSMDSDQALQQTLASYPKKSWISIDAALKPSIHNQKQVLQDSTDFNADAFAIDYLKSNQSKSPLQAYESFLKQNTGKDPTDYRSIWAQEPWETSILPPTLPFLELRKQVIEQYNPKDNTKKEITINQEIWSSLPDERKNAVTIKLLKSNQTVLSSTLFASQLTEQGITLDYQGFQEADKKVIENAGGIHNTPASAVDIVPVFSSPTQETVGAVPVSIGDTLVLQFTPFRGDYTLKESQKFSIAGNREGIAIAFSSHVEQPAHLSSPSAVLLEGNSAIARQYLKTIFQNNDILVQTLNHQYGINFARAVVTQSRILTMDQNNSPSTFDFKGLFIDAHYEYFSYSSTQNYNAHLNKDFRYLSGMNGSYYEAQTLTDLTGMEAVSTITGLTRALSKPNEYQVSLTVKNENKEIIDTLNLSQTTGEQVRARLSSVPKGCITIAPDKPVSLEAWTGFVFMDIALDSFSECGFDTYGIGEQAVGNGGYTGTKTEQKTWKDEKGVAKTSYEAESKDKKDGKEKKYKYLTGSYRDIQCKQEKEWFDEIYSGNRAPGWKLELYGEPCIDENPQFVFKKKDNYYYVLAEGGGFFQSDESNYMYWLSNQEVIDAFKARYPYKAITVNTLRPKYWGTYTFEQKDRIGVFNPELRRVYEMKDAAGNAYKSSRIVLNQYIPALLGYPTGEEADAASFNAYGAEFNGLYQKFTNGTFYTSYSAIPDEVALVFGKMDEKHTFGLGGTAGVGFPEGDPEFSAKEENIVIQDFQKAKRMRHSLATDTVSFETLPIISDRLYNLPQTDKGKADFIEGMVDAFAEFDLYTIGIVIGAVGFGELLWKYKGEIIRRAVQYGIAKASLVVAKKLGAALTLGFLAADVQKFLPIRQACQSDPEKFIEGKSVFYYCGKDKVYSALLFIGLAAPPVLVGKINAYGVVTDAAKAAKTKLFSFMAKASSDQINGLRKALKHNTVRDPLLGNMNRTSIQDKILDDDVKTIADNLSAMPPYYIAHELGFMRLVLIDDFVKAGKITSKQKEALENMHQWVAGQLKGKSFANFDSLRVAYWKKAAEHEKAIKLFNPEDIIAMEKSGKAPALIEFPGDILNLHHLIPRKRDGSLIMEVQNLFPMPVSIHKWTHYEEGGATLTRFGKLNMPDQ